MFRLIASSLALRLWRLQRWQQRRRRQRWQRHYRQTVQMFSTKGAIEASAMAHGRLIDAPEILHQDPTDCALEDLGYPVPGRVEE